MQHWRDRDLLLKQVAMIQKEKKKLVKYIPAGGRYRETKGDSTNAEHYFQSQ